jgi:hypothetical protein
VSDGELASVSYVQAFVNPSIPYFTVIPETKVMVELGDAVKLHAEAMSVPAATYQWQYLDYENSTDVTNSTDLSNSTDTDNSTMTARSHFSFEWHDPAQSFLHLRDIPYVEERDDLVAIWVNFANQTSSTFLMNSTGLANGTVVRCRIRNGGGAAVTSGTTITTFVVPPSPSPTPSPSLFVLPSQRYLALAVSKRSAKSHHHSTVMLVCIMITDLCPTRAQIP